MERVKLITVIFNQTKDALVLVNPNINHSINHKSQSCHSQYSL